MTKAEHVEKKEDTHVKFGGLFVKARTNTMSEKEIK